MHAGKTHSMLGTETQPGIMFQTLVDLFKLMQRRGEQYSFELEMSYIEIYNEAIYDLLVENGDELELREDGQGNASVTSVTWVGVESPQQARAMFLCIFSSLYNTSYLPAAGYEPPYDWQWAADTGGDRCQRHVIAVPRDPQPQSQVLPP